MRFQCEIVTGPVSVRPVSRLSDDELRQRTLRRQFPSISGTGPEAVLELFRRLGPIQSQVPRAPFLTISSRLPGVSYETVCELFESHQLVKTSNIRGTVHTSTVEQFGWLDAVARATRAKQLRNVLKLERATPEQLAAEVEAFAAEDWRPRATGSELEDDHQGAAHRYRGHHARSTPSAGRGSLHRCDRRN